MLRTGISWGHWIAGKIWIIWWVKERCLFVISVIGLLQWPFITLNKITFDYKTNRRHNIIHSYGQPLASTYRVIDNFTFQTDNPLLTLYIYTQGTFHQKSGNRMKWSTCIYSCQLLATLKWHLHIIIIITLGKQYYKSLRVSSKAGFGKSVCHNCTEEC